MSEQPNADRDAGQPLSQNQVESLLKAMESVEPCVLDNRQSSAPCSAAPAPRANLLPSIEPDLMSAIQSLHQSVAVQLAQSFSALLRSDVQVKVETVEQIGSREFEQRSSPYRWLSTLSTETAGDPWLVEIPPELCCAIVDRMLGGDPLPGETFTRSLTDIERRLMERFVDDMLQQLKREWIHVTEIAWNVRHCDNTSMQPPSQDHALVQTRFAVSLLSNQGVIRLAIPATTIQALGHRLSDDDWRNRSRDPRMNHNVAAAPIDVAVTLASSTISTGDLLDLNVGDVIATEKGVTELLDLSIQGIPKFKVRPGALRGKKAVQLDSIVDEGEK